MRKEVRILLAVRGVLAASPGLELRVAAVRAMAALEANGEVGTWEVKEGEIWWTQSGSLGYLAVPLSHDLLEAAVCAEVLES